MNKVLCLFLILGFCFLYARTIEDSRDGQVYEIIDVGYQTWMAENLNYETNGSYCYENDYDYCDSRGRLYTWTAAMQLPSSYNSLPMVKNIELPYRGICPEGWHLPTSAELLQLKEYVMKHVKGDEGVATAMKSPNLWRESKYAAMGTDRFGLSILPTGYYSASGNYFSNNIHSVYYWSVDELAEDWSNSFVWRFKAENELFVPGQSEKADANPVRCVQDPRERPVKKTTFKDNRDGQVYKYVKIGDDVWMSENLNYEANGSACYKYDSKNCAAYGRLYDWTTAMDLGDAYKNKNATALIDMEHRGICPAGWHVPTDREWSNLKEYMEQNGDGEAAGTVLKKKLGWNTADDVRPNTDRFGFSALPGGSKFNGNFYSAGTSAFFWSSAENQNNNQGAYAYKLDYSFDVLMTSWMDKSEMMSLRCVQNDDYWTKDYSGADRVTKERDGRDGSTFKVVHVGQQTWMAQNLNYKVPGSYCYGNKEEYCDIYGRLYTWPAAMGFDNSYVNKLAKSKVKKKHRGVCPLGWHIPSKSDWQVLKSFVERGKGKNGAGKYLKSSNAWGGKGSAEDSYDFNATPAGVFEDGSFKSMGSIVSFWGTDEKMEDEGAKADFMGLFNAPESKKKSVKAMNWQLNKTGNAFYQTWSNKSSAYSVRCIKD